MCFSRKFGSPGGSSNSRTFGWLAARLGSFGIAAVRWPGTTVTAPPVTPCSRLPAGHCSSVYRTSVPLRHLRKPVLGPRLTFAESSLTGMAGTSLSNRMGGGSRASGCVRRRRKAESRVPHAAAPRTSARSATKKSFTGGEPWELAMGPNVRINRRAEAGRLGPVGENVPRTANRAKVACRSASG